jgi:membrane protein DedA with SNARE-associated domain
MLGMLTIDAVLGFVRRHKYAAMFGLIFFSAMGLPVPEEATLISSGLAVGWQEASFLPASVACILGILGSDCFLFAMGRYVGSWLFKRRPFRWMYTPKREARAKRLFERHGSKAVFIGRFFAVLRLGVFVWAGHQRMPWWKFVLMDLAGAVISGPVTILVGMYAATRFDDPAHALDFARRVVDAGGWWLWGVLACVIGFLVIRYFLSRSHRSSSASANEAAQKDKAEESP